MNPKISCLNQRNSKHFHEKAKNAPHFFLYISLKKILKKTDLIFAMWNMLNLVKRVNLVKISQLLHNNQQRQDSMS